MGVQLTSHGQAPKNIKGSNSFKFEPIVLHDLEPTFAFKESMKLSMVDVVKILAEKFT